MSPNIINKSKEKITDKLNELKTEKDNLEKKKFRLNSYFITIYFALFLWMLSGFSIIGNQIIWACLFLLILWFCYYFVFYVIKTYLRTARTVKKKFTKFVNLDEETRDDIHIALDKLTPHFLKRAQNSSIMTFVMIICLLVISISPHFNSDITIRIFGDYMLIMISIFLILFVKLIILLIPNKSFEMFHKTEIMMESSFKDEKIREFASSRKIQRAGVFITAFLGALPSLFCIGSIISFIILYQYSFDLPINIFALIVVLQSISIYLMKQYSSINALLSLVDQLINNLKNLNKKIEDGEIRSKNKVDEEYDKILYTKFQI